MCLCVCVGVLDKVCVETKGRRVCVYVCVCEREREREDTCVERKERVTKMHKHIQNSGKLCKLVTHLKNKT